ncbi:MAG: acyl-CoA dehydrogenase family protein [Thermoplasmatota archaeon]
MGALDPETLEMLLESVREYAGRHLDEERMLFLDRNGELPKMELDDMYDHNILGVHLLLIPEKFGGAGAGVFDIYRICEELARIDLGVATAVFASFLGMDPIREGGTREQQEYWFNRLAEEGLLIAYCATEPEAGSDLGALTTIAVPVRENGELIGYRISGSKQWISNGAIADMFLVLAKDPAAVGWFIVEGDREGITRGAPEDKHGIRAANTSSVTFDNVYVPKENLVGMVEGQGLTQAQAVFGFTRLMVAAFGLGAGWEALERAIRYSQTRIQAGTPLSEKQGYVHKLLVDNAVRLEAGRSYIEYVARRLDGDEEGLQTEGAIAKYMSTDAGNRAAEDAIQALGGYGYVREYMVEKLKRDVRITQIYEGTNEMLEMTITRNRWQEHLKSRGSYYLDSARRMRELHERVNDAGALICSLTMESMASIMEECRINRLTRNQYVMMKLGRLIAMAEASMSFCLSSSLDDYPDSIRFPPDVYRAMSRSYAREVARIVAAEGTAMVIGYGEEGNENILDSSGYAEVMAAQIGMMEDREIVSRGLMEAFRG